MPQVNILMHYFIIFDMKKEPQPGDISMGPICSQLFLIQIYSRTFDERPPALVMKHDYHGPEELLSKDHQHRFHWHPPAYAEETHYYFMQIADEERFQIKPLLRDFIAASAFRPIRSLSF